MVTSDHPIFQRAFSCSCFFSPSSTPSDIPVTSPFSWLSWRWPPPHCALWQISGSCPRLIFRLHILSRIGDVRLPELSLEHLEDLRTQLQMERKLSLKTIKNVIDGSLRALVRDALKGGTSAGFPFPNLAWPRRTVPGPDPFAEEERDRLLSYFLRRTWRLGRSNW